MILLGLSAYHSAAAYSSEADDYFIKGIFFKADTIDIHGGTTDSAKGFTGFFISRVKNNNLYIKPIYFLVTPLNPSGDFKIGIQTDSKKIKNIYLVGNRSDDLKQIWPEK